MTTFIADFSQIDLTGSVRFNGEIMREAYRGGERLWPFGVDLLYTGGIDGASYLPDPADVFSDHVGTSAATFGGSVSLVLDEKNGTPVLGPELLTNGDFSNGGTGWTLNVGWAVSGGVAVGTSVPNFSSVSQNISMVSGRFYRVDITVSVTSGRLQVGIPPNAGPIVSVSGSYSFIIRNTSGSQFAFRADNIGFTGTVDNISVRELPGIHALQSSASLRPLLGRAPLAPRRNLLSRTEEPINPPWPASGFTTVAGVADPLGGNRAIRITSTAAANARFFQSYAAQGAGVAVTHQVWARRVSGTGVVRFGGAANTWLTQQIITLTSEWQKFVATSPSTSGNGTGGGFFGLQLDTLGDTIEFALPQAERGSVDTAYQRVGAVTDVTEAGVPSYPFVRFDLSDDRLDTVLPQAVTGDVVIAGRNGSVIAPHSYAANSTFQLGPTSYTGGTPGILRAIGDVVGWSILDKTLTAAEQERLMRFYKRRGAKGLITFGPELITNGGFDANVSGWQVNDPLWTLQWDAGRARVIRGTGPTNYGLQQVVTGLTVGRSYLLTANSLQNTGSTQNLQAIAGGTYSITGGTLMQVNGPAAFSGSFVAVNTTYMVLMRAANAVSTDLLVDDISLREFRPEEDW